jgi:hypothetical protein
MKQDLASAIKLLSVLAQLQRWEILNSHLLRTASGRQLYFGLIRHLAGDKEIPLVDSLKEIYYDDGIQLTERGVRMTIRAFEADGVVVVERAAKDKRSRRIFLTEKLQLQMLAHAEAMQKTLNENFMVIAK